MADPWYADGLRFSCTQCGKCCTGAPGITWVSEDEADRISALLGLDRVAFERQYCRLVWRHGIQRLTLKDRKAAQLGHACVFYVPGQGCGIYAERPRQCRTWPFWRRIVADPGEWADEAVECPGMNRGELHSQADIEAVAADDGLP